MNELVGNIRSGSITRQIALSSLGVFAVIGLLRKARHSLRINGCLGWLILGFLSWAFLSVGWADDPFLTAKRLFILATLCTGALWMAIELPFREIPMFAFFSSSVLLLIGISVEVVQIALGTLHPLEPGYRFAGQMQSFYQAINCGMMSLAGLALSRTATHRRWLYFASIPFALFFMLLTRTRGPTAGLLVALIGYWSFVLSRSRKIAYLFLASMAIVLAYWIIGDHGFTYLKQASLLGREESTVAEMTGRIPLWDELFRYIARRPLTGYGYDGFWTPAHVGAVSANAGWDNDDSHNAFIELMLGLGIPATLGYALILLVGLKKLVAEWRRSHSVEYAFAVGLLLLFFVNIFLVRIHLLPQIPTFVVLVIFAKMGFTPQLAEIARKPMVALRVCRGCGKAEGT
jgi:O-antigen ligase